MANTRSGQGVSSASDSSQVEGVMILSKSNDPVPVGARVQIGRLHTRWLADDMVDVRCDRLACDPGNAGEQRVSACSWRRSLSAGGSGYPGPLAIVASFVALREQTDEPACGR